MNEREHEIYSQVRALSAEMPAIAMQAVVAGMEDAMQNLRDRLSKKDAAFLSALALAQDARLSAETRRQLNELVAAAINPNNTCELERKALERVS